MRLFSVLLILLLTASPLWAQDAPTKPPPLQNAPEVDHTEIMRRGDLVVVTGEGPRDAGEKLFTMAMAPPADDSDQWYVTVWGKSDDAASLALVKSFENDANLSPFIAQPPGDGKRPWAHFNFYKADDTMQKWRFTEFAIPLAGPFPIVTITPPRDGSFGGITKVAGKDGKQSTRSVVIDRIEAKELGGPAVLRRRITASTRLWTEKLAKSGFVPPARVVHRYEDERMARASDSHGQTAPWGPNPPAPTPVNPQWPPGGPAADPTTPPGGGLSIPIKLPSLQGILMFLLTASNIWLLYRDIAKKAGIPLLVDEATMAFILELLGKLKPPAN